MTPEEFIAGFKVGDVVKFPKAPARWNRDAAYGIRLIEEGEVRVSVGRFNWYDISIEDCMSLGMVIVEKEIP